MIYWSLASLFLLYTCYIFKTRAIYKQNIAMNKKFKQWWPYWDRSMGRNLYCLAIYHAHHNQPQTSNCSLGASASFFMCKKIDNVTFTNKGHSFSSRPKFKISLKKSYTYICTSPRLAEKLGSILDFLLPWVPLGEWSIAMYM